MNQADNTGGMPDFSDPVQLRDHLEQLFSDPTLLPDSFKSWLPNHLSVNPADITIDQVIGYQENTAKNAVTINAEESLTSSIYGDLTTVGPVLTGLGNGTYTVNYGCSAKISNANTRAKANISINGVVSDTATPQAYTSNTGGMVGCSVSGVQVVLSAGVSGNTIKLQYCVGVSGSGVTGTWGARYLSATRISN